MTTNHSTSSNTVPLAVPQASGGGIPAGVPDPGILEQLANELFRAVPGSGPHSGAAVPLGGASATAAQPALGANPLQGAPVGGVPGHIPLASLDPTDTAAYHPTSGLVSVVPPGAAPPDLYGFDPSLVSLAPTAISALGPRSMPGRKSVPGTHLISTPPATPGVEVGSLPAATLVSPASGYALPDESNLHFLHGATREFSVPDGGQLYPQDAGASFYFLDHNPKPEAPSTNTWAELAARGTELEPLPELGNVFSQPGKLAGIPPSWATGAPETPAGGSPVTASGEVGSGIYYFLDESRAFTAQPASGHSEPDMSIDAGPLGVHPGFDVNIIRRDFPILQENVNGRPLIWFDNAATTQKPQAVIDRLAYFYSHENSNIHRAAHELAARATDAYEAAREKVKRFLGASSSDEIVFARGTTELINLVAQAWGRRNIEAGDEIVITWLEHHANIVPWQQLCKETGAKLKVAPVDEQGQVLLDEYEKLFTSRTKLASFTQVSNALGTVTPVKEMIEIAHRHGARVLVDGAQAVSHMKVNVQELDCDWYVFSGHKVLGPTGIGALYGKLDLLNAMPPWQGGGNMIQDVTFEKTIYQPAPNRFEAGTGNIADAVGLGAALDYVERIGMENIARYEHALLVYGTRALCAIPGLRLIGTAAEKASVLSFVLDGFRSEDVGVALNREGIAVRAGHHCAQPILRRYGLETTVRPSLAFYNTCAEVDALQAALLRIQSGSVALDR